MRKKFEFDYFQNNNNIKFNYHNNTRQIPNQVDKWSKLESILQRNRKEKYFSNDTISTLNIGTLKSLEWEEEDIKNIPTQKSDNNLDLSLTFFLSRKYIYLNL